MTWQLAILCLLGLTILAGSAWYERSRPPSQVVALVAALAALAVAGRVAFSPIPNVVPTTDIVLIAGATLGAAPGFAVGALAALVSNFWLGQGPWTPWQMAGWGLVGIAGALVARARGRDIGRLELAAYCGIAGLAYGALLDLSLMVTYGGEQSLERFLALSVRGLPFNIAHAAGNVAFALVAGPALLRMLSRYRERFEFAWGGGRTGGEGRTALRGAAGAACVAIGIASSALAGTHTEPASAGASGSAVSYLRAAQNEDGGFSVAPDSLSSLGMTGWASLGLEGAGVNPTELRAGGNSPIAYLRREGRSLREVGDLERTILLLAGAGLNPRAFAGQDLVAKLRAGRRGDGSWSGQVNPTAFGILALEAAGAPRGNGRSAAWLSAARASDGGWAFVADADSGDADSTGAALQALAAAGGNRGAMSSGVHWLRRAQRPGGGFELVGGGVNSQSTAWAVQGLVAAGVDPARVRRGGRSGLDYLASMQAGDGHYRYSASSDQTPVWVTAQALLATNRKSFPLAAVPPESIGNGRGGGDAAGGVGEVATPASPGKGTAPVTKAPPQGATAGASAASPPAPPTAMEADPGQAEGDDDGDGSVPWIAAAVILALLGAVWAGWVVYRRRLPAS